ncbi:uncharacterized protein FPRO_03701 [Fusarium proliferatum ET1]|uniref:Uncharacterized protein n=1 Tax=Fusarium proliferatum (strain ET1) TaxID=1227346 RepID=A0A1L7V5B3_FUSPR|nr:uncharacterized protein FPRO_03701 [Fusarium proliferatum ET1]CZR36039.1 uncharacterized protein FPRO_03701 [Fusarium proliferatum ET1]
MPSDIFNRLPPEIHINVVKCLKTQEGNTMLHAMQALANHALIQDFGSLSSYNLLRDVRSFTSASPTARRYFYANQCAFFIQPYIQNISKIFQDESLVSLAVILLQARKIRARARGLTSPQIEQSIKPCLDAFTRFEKSVPEEEWKEDLGCITALIDMNREFDHIVYQYSSRERWSYQVPQSSYRSNFINHFLRYDLYCQLGCHGEDKLFAENEHIKKLESHLYKLILPKPQTGSWEVLNMIWLIKKILKSIIRSVDSQVQYVGDGRKEINQVDEIIRQGGPSDFVMQRLRECRFKSRLEYDTKIFLDHACLQGYPFILSLRQPTRDARKALIDMFFKITVEKLQEKAGKSGSTRCARRLESLYRSLAS